MNNTEFFTLIKNGDYQGIKIWLLASLPSLIYAAAIIIIGFIIVNIIGKLVVKGLKMKGVDPSIHAFIKTLITLVLKFTVVLSALSAINIDVNSFITALGAVGVAAGLGLQASVSQIASGVQILINHPFRSGDYVDIGTVSGVVHEIKMMYTVLKTVDNKKVIVPNSTITASNIINYSAENRRRIDLEFSVSYGTDINTAKAAILDVIKNCPLLLTDPEPVIGVKSHGESSVVIATLVWCMTEDYWSAFYYMQENVKAAFDSKDISIPFNQLDIHIVKD